MTKRVGWMHASTCGNRSRHSSRVRRREGKESDSAAPAAGAAASNAPGKDKITIAMIAKSSTNPVFLAARTGAEAAAKELSEKNQHSGERRLAHAAAGRRPGAGAAHPAGGERRRGRHPHLVLRRRQGHGRDQRRGRSRRAVMTFDSDAPQSKRFAYYGVDDVEDRPADDGRAGEAA